MLHVSKAVAASLYECGTDARRQALVDEPRREDVRGADGFSEYDELSALTRAIEHGVDVRHSALPGAGRNVDGNRAKSGALGYRDQPFYDAGTRDRKQHLIAISRYRVERYEALRRRPVQNRICFERGCTARFGAAHSGGNAEYARNDVARWCREDAASFARGKVSQDVCERLDDLEVEILTIAAYFECLYITYGEIVTCRIAGDDRHVLDA